ncbi:hypothetical protein M4I32_14530 [Microbacterium sp. LRZ72]|uniref:hypothetical protein n=1 Tax=Microbacterium sp. LRZ72 TaxID=2942481 RepID=UPI0029B67B3B|nr:hypothetical protein [Microbacterium sp. LRZ72]MDX2378010.1 hypothetical protein [Microbacterium sp. LRZ72]
MEQPPAATVTDREDTAARAPHRLRRRRDRHNHDALASLDILDLHPLEAEQQVAAGTAASGGARISAPRTIVRHVEVLGRSSGWRY